MESGPNKIVERVAGVLIPPACREEILGDMRQRHRTSGRYLLEALHTVPCVIYSRIRRTTDAVIAVAEGSSMLTAFVMAAWWLDRALIAAEGGLMRLAIPPIIFLSAMILADAYADPKRRWLLRPLFAPALGCAAASIVQARLDEWSLPGAVFAWGSALSVLLLSALRLMFPPVADRPQTANVPAYWLKLELAPPSVRFSTVLVPAAIVIVMILYVLLR